MISTKIVTEVNDGMDVMKHEIFGPILPILTYESISEAVDYINSNDNPLGLYYFGRSQTEQNFVINNTRSGGVTERYNVSHFTVQTSFRRSWSVRAWVFSWI